MSKRRRIICHMASSIDGKIDGSALRNVMRSGEYEALHSQLGGNAWLCGRTTMQQHFADSEPFVSKTNTPAGAQSVHIARRAESYAISVDTLGKLRWSSNDLSVIISFASSANESRTTTSLCCASKAFPTSSRARHPWIS
jgi:2,5-diamino-6-(ribosylamino)-4(3H)-pyrimidinone 5'-phosphate reductase